MAPDHPCLLLLELLLICLLSISANSPDPYEILNTPG